MKLGVELKQKLWRYQWIKMFCKNRLEISCLNDDGQIPPESEILTSLDL